MENIEKYEFAGKRLSNISLVGDYCFLLRNNILLEHFEKYMKNEAIWFDFLAESVKINDLILPVLLFGKFNSVYQEMKEICNELETNDTIIKSIGIKEIHLLNYYSRFMSLCDMMKRFGEFDSVYKQIIRYKKRAFYGLKAGDIIYIKVHRNIGEKFCGGVIRRKFDEWLKSRVVRVEIEKEKIQVEYGRRWFELADYPDTISTTNDEDFFKVDKSIWDIEHGKDELFNLLKNKK